MISTLEGAYREHHHDKRRGGFAILEKERGALFKKLVGVGKKVLDLGCRDGVITKYFIEGNDVTGVDIDSVALETAREGLGIKILSFDIQAHSWPIQSESFDVVVAGELLEHIYFPGEIMQKINKVLRPGGSFIGSVPNAFALKNRIKYLFAVKRGTPLEDPMHINQFSWPDLAGLFQSCFGSAVLYPLGKKFGGVVNISPSLLAYSIAFSAKKVDL